MQDITKMWFILLMVSSVVLFTGCTDWEQKYQGLEVEHHNLQGLYENCITSLETSNSEKAQLGTELNQKIQSLEELQNQVEESDVSPGQASGFGDDMDVKFDSSSGTITVTLPNAILFKAGKATMLKSQSAELDHILSVIHERYYSNKIDVVGHTDADPIKKSGWKDNWELSAQRALTVLRYLQSKGIKSDRIRAVAAGASRPIASNATSTGKARNRRVEIVVHM